MPVVPQHSCYAEDQVVIVDSGKKTRYSATLNPGNDWAEDILPYGIMHKAHYLWQLKCLKPL